MSYEELVGVLPAATIVDTPEGAAVLADLLSGPVDPVRHARLATYDMLPTHDDPLVVACDRYLERKKAQLWGPFSIARVDDRWDAACWLAEQIRAVVGDECGLRAGTGVDPEEAR